MNAYELADQLERDVKDFFPIPDEVCLKAIAMLRQQQAEIEELKAKLKSEFDYIEKKFSEEWWSGVKEYNEQRKKNK